MIHARHVTWMEWGQCVEVEGTNKVFSARELTFQWGIEEERPMNILETRVIKKNKTGRELECDGVPC